MLHSLGLIYWTDTFLCIAAIKSTPWKILHWFYFCIQSCAHGAYTVQYLVPGYFCCIFICWSEVLEPGVGTHMLCLGQDRCHSFKANTLFLPGAVLRHPFKFNPHSLQREGWNQKEWRIQIKEEAWELRLTKLFLTQIGGDVQHLQPVNLQRNIYFEGWWASFCYWLLWQPLETWWGRAAHGRGASL